MEKRSLDPINNGQTIFDKIKHVDEAGIEYWIARELMPYLDYSKWQYFNRVIDRAIISCETGGVSASDQFTDLRKLVKRSQGGGKARLDYKLTRYACYLITQNGDPSKEVIAKAQSYFAVQTRKQEILEAEQLKRLEEDDRLEARGRQKLTQKEFHHKLRRRGHVDPKHYAICNNLRNMKLHKKPTKKLKEERGLPPKGVAVAESFNLTELNAYAFETTLDNHGIENFQLTELKEINHEISGNCEFVYDKLASKNVYFDKMTGSENLLDVQKRRKREEKLLASGLPKQELFPGRFNKAIQRSAPPVPEKGQTGESQAF